MEERSEFPIKVAVSVIAPGGGFVSTLDCMIIPEELPDVIDVKGRLRPEKIRRSIVLFASTNFGNEKAPATVRPKLISAMAHINSQAML